MTKLEQVVEIVDGMKGEMELSYRHMTDGWYLTCWDKYRTRSWSAHEVFIRPHYEEFYSLDNVCDAILKVFETKEF